MTSSHPLTLADEPEDDSSPDARLFRHFSNLVYEAQDVVRRSQVSSPFKLIHMPPAPTPPPLAVPQAAQGGAPLPSPALALAAVRLGRNSDLCAGAPLSPISENSHRVSANHRSGSLGASLDAAAKVQRHDGAASRENFHTPDHKAERKAAIAQSSYTEVNSLSLSVDVGVRDMPDADIRKTVEMMLAAERQKLRGVA